MKKSEFKKILKECLKELIEEGIFDNNIQTNDKTLNLESRQRKAALEMKDGLIKNLNFEKQAAEMAFMLSKNKSTKDQKIFQNILEDTAKTTYIQQISHDSGNSTTIEPSPEQTVRDMHDLESAFPNMSHWAIVAKGGKK